MKKQRIDEQYFGPYSIYKIRHYALQIYEHRNIQEQYHLIRVCSPTQNKDFNYEIIARLIADCTDIYRFGMPVGALHNQTPDDDQVTSYEQLSSTRESMGPAQIIAQKDKLETLN